MDRGTKVSNEESHMGEKRRRNDKTNKKERKTEKIEIRKFR